MQSGVTDTICFYVTLQFFFHQIYDGPTAASNLIGTYCHAEQLIQLESTSNTVFVRFVSDINTNDRGFELKFSASKRAKSDVFLFLMSCWIDAIFLCFFFRLQSRNSWFTRCYRYVSFPIRFSSLSFFCFFDAKSLWKLNLGIFKLSQLSQNHRIIRPIIRIMPDVLGK